MSTKEKKSLEMTWSPEKPTEQGNMHSLFHRLLAHRQNILEDKALRQMSAEECYFPSVFSALACLSDYSLCYVARINDLRAQPSESTDLFYVMNAPFLTCQQHPRTQVQIWSHF